MRVLAMFLATLRQHIGGDEHDLCNFLDRISMELIHQWLLARTASSSVCRDFLSSVSKVQLVALPI
jgi:hypothetical protein